MSVDKHDENIIELLGPHDVIGQALGVLMAEHDLSRDAAFEMLVQGSTDSHQKVRRVAERIIEESLTPGLRPPP
ncbi:MAG: hypothetical protein JWR90_953 [Marmoricola sp.]|jgi:AmiR/NasT family two-component response regulator|nr:hypothetical protein [Marmoricola sp.]